ncbi:sensor histidine kinase [Micromonospora sp. NPDC049275]|uniref:sensor histidine kinase n=1 Tax=Micromonospora sp. NPDC049275 TaxID=3364268 RepID=UPI00371219E0
MAADKGQNEVTNPNFGTALLRGAALTGLAITEALQLLWISLCVCLTVVGIGVPLLPRAINGARSLTALQRRLARRWTGVTAEEEYLPLPDRPGFVGDLHRAWTMLGDRSTWRDLRWLLVNPFVGPVLGFLPVVAIVEGLWGLTLPFTWEMLEKDWGWDNIWFAFIPLNSQTTAWLAAGLGLVEIVVGVILARVLQRVHGRWAGAMLDGRSRAELTRRVQHLAVTRSDAVSQQAAEIKRIERDLHDGAQARLVSMGMTLATVETLLQKDPEQALAMVTDAKNSSATALRELRDLVRGIHPPVLADRGLVDAVRALAMSLPLRVEVTADVPGRVTPPVESAVYFVVSELLNNVIKHAHATHATVDMRYIDGKLRVTVHDNGVGGTDPERGTGLKGIERRLLPFDGFVTVFSPVGGTTDVAVEVPTEIVTAD